MDLNQLLLRAVDFGASDIHLKLGKPPMVRRDGNVAPLPDWPVLEESDLESALVAVTQSAPAKRDYFYETGDLDVAYSSPELPRFRCNVFRQRGAISFALRVIPKKVPRFEDLGLPPGIGRLAEEHRGLVLVTGATGSGKTTTLAAMIDHINRTRQQHIVTIEDPIEVLHADQQCIINQREVGLDTESFGQALRRALRQDPDVILIGELRDAETAQTALQAAETIGRMIEFFPEGKQQQIRSIMAGVLRGVVSQRLLPALNGGRVAAVEVMVMNARIADLIREDKADEIPAAIAEGEFFQMQTFTQALIERVLDGRVDREIAANAASNRHDFLVALERAVKQRSVATTNANSTDDSRPLPLRPTERPQPAPALEATAPVQGLRVAPSPGV